MLLTMIGQQVWMETKLDFCVQLCKKYILTLISSNNNNYLNAQLDGPNFLKLRYPFLFIFVRFIQLKN